MYFLRGFSVHCHYSVDFALGYKSTEFCTDPAFSCVAHTHVPNYVLGAKIQTYEWNLIRSAQKIFMK